VNSDGVVDTADLLALLAAWGDCPHPPCPWDFNGDGVVDELDLIILLQHGGDCPDPPEDCPWDLNGDGEVDTTSQAGELRIFAPRKPGSYSVVLRVRDNEGNVSSPDTAALHVMDSPPAVALGPDTTVKVGVRVPFVPRITCHCGKPVNYEWDLDDDGVYEYRSRRHGRTSRVYYRPGRFRVRFRVTDELGRQAGAIRRITVGGSHAD
jgi:PKD repeat protein